MSDPIVSVIITTYNHEKFIRSAIEGCLVQKTSFPIEIIIHDDASTDNTENIIREYADKHPEVIIPILQVVNQKSKGVNILHNFILPIARGKYLAHCEGDDYWTDPKKLENQIVFLENHPEFSGSAHQSLIIGDVNERLFRKNIKPIINDTDLFQGRLFHTASFVYRKAIYDQYPPPPKNIHSGDRLLFILVAATGPIRYFDDVMCVYRKHEGGASATSTYNIIKKDFATVDYFQDNLIYFPRYRYLSFLHNICMLYPLEKLPINIIIEHYFPFVLYSFSYFPKNIRKIIGTTLKLIGCIDFVL